MAASQSQTAFSLGPNRLRHHSPIGRRSAMACSFLHNADDFCSIQLPVIFLPESIGVDPAKLRIDVACCQIGLLIEFE